MQDQTLRTLAGLEGSGRGKVFNKLRMTVFPKWYVYNHAIPVEAGTAYEIIPGSVAANATAWGCQGGSGCPTTKGSFDFTRFNVSYWRNYERLLRSMRASGVVADIIVFHPYDGGQWGFDCMGGTDPSHYNTSNDERYLKYLAARFASFDNVWWSMANEWSDCACKSLGSKRATDPANPRACVLRLTETVAACQWRTAQRLRTTTASPRRGINSSGRWQRRTLTAGR